MDSISPDKRSNNMRAVKSVSKLETSVSRALWRNGIRFRRNVKDLLGKPDIVIKKYNIVIFIDSCFWHGCSIHYKPPQSNKEYWYAKITRNQNRDKIVNDFYQEKGWNVLRVWEHDLKRGAFEETVGQITDFIYTCKATCV
ncbi:very short patch repair endonuclease [Paenibacillus sp. FSL H8-0034]|uniref:very short patch repair endonuclease n=1 Tax=Paenibacillus sp. FSL H8-0034 TaxID=2954671 RepID=UPI0030FD06E7